MSKARKFLVAAAALTLLLVCGTAFFLHGQEEYVPQAQATKVDTERSQVYLTGEGYELDKQQEKIHEKQEKQREQKQVEKRQDPKRIRPANTQSDQKIRNDKVPKKDPGNKKPSDTKPHKEKDPTNPKKPEKDPTDPTKAPESEEDRAKKPDIKISVVNGDEINGSRLDFSVTVTDYKGRNVPVYSESDGSFTVTCNGAKLSGGGVDGKKTWFGTELLDGNNTITVSAVDRDGNAKEKTVRFKGNTSAAAESVGNIYVCIDASILNLGVLFDTQVEITKGDTAKDVLQTAFEQAGISGSFKGGYLSEISRSGIAAGAWISDDVREIMEGMRKTEKDPADQDPDRLKEHDFYDSSGWIYSVNGEFPTKGLGSYKMEDGDELYLIFSLADGVY